MNALRAASVIAVVALGVGARCATTNAAPIDCLASFIANSGMGSPARSEASRVP
jgi:hypothetical protein